MYSNDDWVYSVQVRSVDAPELVAGDREELEGRIGELMGFEQCDNCGNSLYLIERRGNAFAAVCTTDPDVDTSEEHFEGCGTRWPIGLRQVREVAMA